MDQTKNPRFNERKGKKVSFIDFLSKIKISPERRLKKRKRIKLGKEGDTILAAAEWVDEELKENIKKREKLSRGWRIARNRGEPPEILEKYEKAYKEIYQKTQRADLAFWYGVEGYMRKKQEMEGNEKDEYRGIMKEPQIKRRRTGDNIP